MTEEMDIQFEFENAARFSYYKQPFPLIYKTPLSIKPDGSDVEVVGAVWKMAGDTFACGAITKEGECIAIIDYPERDLGNAKDVCWLVAQHFALKLQETNDPSS